MKRDVKPGFQKPTNNQLNVPGGGPGRPQPAVGKGETSGWILAVHLTERWLARSERVDSLLEQLTPGLPAQERARAQHLFFGVVRWASRLDAALEGLMVHAPRTKVRAVLLVTGFELWEGGSEATAKVVHHAVEKAKAVTSPVEARLVNAVARKMAARLAEKPATAAAEFAHPEWLVARWTKQFGAEATTKLLEWNQSPAPVYARWRSPLPAPEFLAAARWPGFFGVKAGHWDAVRKLAGEGALYLQDPSTRMAVELLAPQPHETILDACAAPGGKSLMIADAMAGELARRGAVTGVPAEAAATAGRVVALDEEGPRLVRLKANLNHAPASVQVALMPADLLKVSARFFKDYNLPEIYDAVLLDAPCTNTGVMRHRVDVKWRLRAGDFAQHAAQQLALLKAAARLVREGGRLVYSTCSLDPVENEEVVQLFLRDARGWKLERQVVAYPWIDGHDGAGAFLLIRWGRK
jgi:16S rRNA (cytosine967-C5)-methyltransferase